MNNEKLKKEEILKKEKELQQEAEREAILMKADENKHEVLELDFEGNMDFKNEIEALMLSPVDNPEEKHQLYYKVINQFLRKHLPKGEEFKQARELIYEEKNTFLSGGHRINERGIRGADGRMGYVDDMHTMVNIITTWITSNGGMYELYSKMRDFNIEKGYGKA